MNGIAKRFIAYVLAISLIGVVTPPMAFAGLVGTQEAIALEQNARPLGKIDSVLAEESVRSQLIALGVDPSDAQSRIAALSDSELAELNAKLPDLPAGGSILAVVGIVFVVLLILEVVGVTNVFTAI